MSWRETQERILVLEAKMKCFLLKKGLTAAGFFSSYRDVS